jgi:hypothetical protein
VVRQNETLGEFEDVDSIGCVGHDRELHIAHDWVGRLNIGRRSGGESSRLHRGEGLGESCGGVA